MDIVVLAASPIADRILNILTVALGLGLVIFFHELGHFAVAKWCNVLVERFSIGFGPILWRKKWGETEYALSAIPFGGYVKMLGQDDIDPGQMTDDQVATDPRSYSAKSVPQRMAIISAGVTMNIITGLMFFMLAFRGGIETSEPQVGYVRPGMSAWLNGLREGDVITAMNGQPVNEFTDILRQTALSRGDIRIVGRHANGETFDKTFSPDRNQFRRMIGISPQFSLRVPQVRDPQQSIAVKESPAAAAGFKPGDEIVQVDSQPVASYPELLSLLSAKRDETVEVVVNRAAEDGKSKAPTTLTVAPQPFRSIGLQMSIGKIVAVRNDSPASTQGIQPGDLITHIDEKDVGKELDPMRLTDYFSDKAGQPVKIRIKREVKKDEPKVLELNVTPEARLAWSEPPVTLEKSPLSIPSLGIAYDIQSFIVTVAEDGPAATLGLKPGDAIVRMTLPAESSEEAEAGPTRIQVSDSADGKKAGAGWPHAFWRLQQRPSAKEVTLSVRSPGTDETRDVTIVPQEIEGWNQPTTRGLYLGVMSTERKAESAGEALAMSWTHTRNSVIDIYLTLRNLFTGDLSVGSLHGPIGIAKTASIFAEEGLADFLLFLGLISINLAVINFLPIPVLDGGHMVFLVWEAITRRKPSERVVIAATYVGLAFVAGLMLTVLYVDLFVDKK